MAGLPIALTREVAKRPAAAKRLLLHGSLAVILPATLSMLAMILLAFLMQYERQTILVIAILALAVPPYTLAVVTESVIKGRDQMQLIALGCLPGNVFLVACSFAVLTAGYSVPGVAVVIVASRVITLVAMLLLLHFGAGDAAGATLAASLLVAVDKLDGLPGNRRGPSDSSVAFRVVAQQIRVRTGIRPARRRVSTHAALSDVLSERWTRFVPRGLVSQRRSVQPRSPISPGRFSGSSSGWRFPS